MIRRAHLAIGLALAVCGCSVKGTNIAPVAPAAPRSFEAAADPALASTLPVDAWWTTFADNTITTLVERALSGSPDVRGATAVVRLARARLREPARTIRQPLFAIWNVVMMPSILVRRIRTRRSCADCIEC